MKGLNFECLVFLGLLVCVQGAGCMLFVPSFVVCSFLDAWTLDPYGLLLLFLTNGSLLLCKKSSIIWMKNGHRQLSAIYFC
ncbi:hypothetical protein BS78_06G193500 [Paspalum vaginatum]|nr:hypothetical protein BS78_06G193500 [Paspalum vaginatum]